jgi:hypothetical protein
MEPINGVWFLLELEVLSTVQLSFHEGVGNHRSVLVDVGAKSAIGKQEFQVVHLHARRLRSTNVKACTKYLSYLEQQMQTHRMADQLSTCEKQITSYPAPPDVQHHMQRLNSQTLEMQWGAEHQCRQLYVPAIPFSKPTRVVHFRW